MGYGIGAAAEAATRLNRVGGLICRLRELGLSWPLTRRASPASLPAPFEPSGGGIAWALNARLHRVATARPLRSVAMLLSGIPGFALSG